MGDLLLPELDTVKNYLLWPVYREGAQASLPILILFLGSSCHRVSCCVPRTVCV